MRYFITTGFTPEGTASLAWSLLAVPLRRSLVALMLLLGSVACGDIRSELFAGEALTGEMKPAAGKLDRKTCPVIHIDYPEPFGLNVRNISTDVPLARGSRFAAAPNARNLTYGPEGNYVIEIGDAKIGRGTFRTSDSGYVSYEIVSWDFPEPLRLKVLAQNGRHYYVFAPVGALRSPNDAFQVPYLPYAARDSSSEPSPGIRWALLAWGLLKACVVESDSGVLTPAQVRALAEGAPDKTVCDALDEPRLKAQVERSSAR
jgi:hypothetical protein